MARPSAETNEAPVTRVDWDEFSAYFASKHKQGQHVSIVGPTGSGKTVLGLELCKIIAKRTANDGRPARVVVLSVKPRDKTMTALGWPIIKEWPPSYGEEHCIVWPKGGDPETRAARQRTVFGPLLRVIYNEGRQTVFIDEAAYFEANPPNGLGLAATLDEFWRSARALSLTLIAGTQRPRRVSRSMWSEPDWVFVYPPDDQDDLKRVAEFTGGRKAVLDVADDLRDFQFLCLHREPGGRRGRLLVSKVEL